MGRDPRERERFERAKAVIRAELANGRAKGAEALTRAALATGVWRFHVASILEWMVETGEVERVTTAPFKWAYRLTPQRPMAGRYADSREAQKCRKEKRKAKGKR